MNAKINLARNIVDNTITVRIVSQDGSKVRTLTMEEQRRLAVAIGEIVPSIVDQSQPFPAAVKPLPAPAA